jgi:hypothetical protein
MGSEQEKGYESRYVYDPIPFPGLIVVTRTIFAEVLQSIRLTLTSTGQSEIRVLKDDAPVERTEYNDREVADSDQQLGMPFASF